MEYSTTLPVASGYPESPGFRGLTERSRETSRAAADTIAKAAKSQAARILKALADAPPQGLSSDEVAIATGIRVYSVRARMSGLLAAGKVEQTDEHTKNGDGFSVVLWKAVA